MSTITISKTITNSNYMKSSLNNTDNSDTDDNNKLIIVLLCIIH